MDNHSIFAPFSLYDLTLSNRIVMAPLTRCRAGKGDCPTSLNATYYKQRASAGLIISEASQISQQGKGYAFTPGIYSNEQCQGWKLVTKAVHDANGKIFCQLWHVGRISHPLLQKDHALPVAPSAIKPTGFAMTEQGKKEFVTPHALELNEISEILNDYKHAALIAKKAGFDGIEIHAANGYLIDQFIRSGSNKRSDIYGGNIENRIRFCLEVVEKILSVWPSHRVGIRLSPVSTSNDMQDDYPFETFSTLIESLNRFNLSYIHCIEGTARLNRDLQNFDFYQLRKKFNGYYIANNMYDINKAKNAIDNQNADLICFGRPFISNPDLVYRLQNNIPLSDAPMQTWYGGIESGYTDWPNA